MKDAYWVPINPADVYAISELLRAKDVFTPSFNAPNVDTYEAAVYLRELHEFGTETVLRLDRNVFTRIVALARGEPPTESHRLAAAVVAFAQCSHIQIEPNMALYELAQSGGQTEAADELVAFRAADHMHPGYWADIALGRADRVPRASDAGSSPMLREEVDFSIPLRRWTRNYILCLKLAELELTPGSAAERFRKFVSWSYGEFILGGPSIALAAYYLAPNSPKKRLLKGLRSPDRERAIEGIRNATWDLTLVSQWLLDVEKQDEKGRLVLLTSFDVGVHRLARAVADTAGFSQSTEDPLGTLLCDLWGVDLGCQFALQIKACYATRDAGWRRINFAPSVANFKEDIQRREAVIRQWKPTVR